MLSADILLHSFSSFELVSTTISTIVFFLNYRYDKKGKAVLEKDVSHDFY